LDVTHGLRVTFFRLAVSGGTRHPLWKIRIADFGRIVDEDLSFKDNRPRRILADHHLINTNRYGFRARMWRKKAVTRASSI
jgi:hypothetical protein